MKLGNRHWDKGKLRASPVGSGASHGMIEKIETDLHSARTVGNERTREPAGIDVERGLPGVINPGRAGKPIFANDLRVEMQRRARFAPRLVRDIWPRGAHVVCSFAGFPVRKVPAEKSTSVANHQCGAEARGIEFVESDFPELT